MLLAERFAGSTFVQSTLSARTESQNITAFAARDAAHGWKAAIFNKADVPVTVKIEGLPASGTASIQWLQAPAIDSHDGVTFAGSAVGGSGEFHPQTQARVKIAHGSGTLDLPAYTAAFIEG